MLEQLVDEHLSNIYIHRSDIRISFGFLRSTYIHLIYDDDGLTEILVYTLAEWPRVQLAERMAEAINPNLGNSVRYLERRFPSTSCANVTDAVDQLLTDLRARFALAGTGSAARELEEISTGSASYGIAVRLDALLVASFSVGPDSGPTFDAARTIAQRVVACGEEYPAVTRDYEF